MILIRYINAFAILVPIILGLLGFISNDMWFYAAWSTMLTGIVQVTAALATFLIGYNRTLLTTYFVGVILYFFAMYMGLDGYYYYYVPISLALFLTFILYKKPIK